MPEDFEFSPSELILAADKLGLSPMPGEPKCDFYVRVAVALERDRRRHAKICLAVRIGISATLAALGLGWF